MSPSDIKQFGLRATGQRQKILKILSSTSPGAKRHLTAESIFKQLQDQQEEVGLATVYRTLGQFEKAGLVIKHQFDDDSAVYELDSGEHHDHMVCVCCGKIEEFVDEVIEKRQLDIATRAGFQLTDHHLNLYGLCSLCVKKKG